MSKCFIVLGMHRSGTSCLAGILRDNGVYLGDDLTTLNERVDLFMLNERIFNFNGGDWLNPPDKVEWCSQDKTIRDKIISDLSTHDVYGIKDPRMPFVLEGWLEVIENPQFIATIRNPYEVADSLYARNKVKLGDAIRIWRKYNDKIASLEEVYGPFPTVNFSSSTYESNLKALLINVGLPGDVSGYKPELVHHVLT